MTKRIFALTLAVLLFLMPILSSCAGNGETNSSSESESSSGSSIPADADIYSWMSEGYNKVVGNARKPKELLKSFNLNAAKNEAESCHVTIKSNVDLKDLGFVLVEGANDNVTVEILEEYLVKTGAKMSPDPIAPFDGAFDVTANESKSLLLRFKTTAETEAGVYEFKFKLTDSLGNTIEEYTVVLDVWNFALPEELGCDTAGDIREDQVQAKEKLSFAAFKKGEYYKKYYDMLIEYKFSPHDLPYDILDERADAYMSNPNVTGFRVDYKFDDEKLAQIYEKLCSNPVWLEKAYFYIYDEPNDVDALNIVAERVNRVRAICPEIDVLVAFFRNVKYDDTRDQIDFMSEYVDVFCAKSAAWGPQWLADPLGNGYFGDRMNALKEQGNKVWWYVCWEPGNPYCNMYVDEIGVQHRELFWQQYYYESDGFLYWSTTYWPETDNPWLDMANVKSLSPSVYGDGSLLYPGNYIGIEGPVASLRLECIRDGVEDFDLLTLAEQYLGREWVIDQVVKVSESLTEHTKSNELFAETRKAIGDALEAAINAAN